MNVSVCIPTYNRVDYLAEAIESVEAQSYRDLEIVFSDSGSTDGTVSLIERYMERSSFPCRLLANSTTTLASNWNHCLDHADGRWIKFLCSDDTLRTHCLEKMVFAAETYPDVSLVFSPRGMIVQSDAHDHPICQQTIDHYAELHLGWKHLETFQSGKQLLADPNLVHESSCNKIGEPTCVLLSSAALRVTGGFRPELLQLIDLEMWWRQLAVGNVVFLDEKLSDFRIHAEQMTVKNHEDGESIGDGAVFATIVLNSPMAEHFHPLTIEHLEGVRRHGTDARGSGAGPFFVGPAPAVHQASRVVQVSVPARGGQHSTMPMVSIIVPNYNHERYLPERLDSVFNQTFRDFEVILMDDCSTDDSRQVIDRYRNRPEVTHCVVSNANSGSPFMQWSRGIALSKGKYIWIAESDDIARPTLLERLVGRLEANDQATLAYCRSRTIDEHSHPLQEGHLYPSQIDEQRWQQDFCNDGQHECANYLAYLNTVPNASAVVFRRDACTRVELPVTMRYCGDWLFWARLLGEGHLEFVADGLNDFRCHQETSRSRPSRRQDASRFAEYLKIFDELSVAYQPSRHAEPHNHRWMVNDWKQRELTSPLSLFRDRSISLSNRFRFCLSYEVLKASAKAQVKKTLSRTTRRAA